MLKTALACLNASLPHATMWMAHVIAFLDTSDQHVNKVQHLHPCVGYIELKFILLHAECPDGFYGQDCLDVCNCVNGDCDFITGFCNCSIGYVGVACDMSKYT